MKAPNKIYVEVCEEGIFAFPEPPFKESVEYIRNDSIEEQPEVYQRGYEQAEQNIVSLIESRIAEILGDAQPAPVLRAELREPIERIKEESK